MVLYFSATGNSKYVAERIAAEIDANAVSISEYAASERIEIELSEDAPVGIVTPVYFGGFPSNVKDFLRRTSLKGTGYIFVVVTYGMTTGASEHIFKKSWNSRNRAPDAFFCIKMPDTYTLMYDLSDSAAVQRTNQAAEKELAVVIEKIKSRTNGNYLENKMPFLAGKVFHSLYGLQNKTAGFHVTDDCTGCGLCEQKCPAQAIRMENGRPAWVKDRCIMCLGCLHRCPKFAIQNGRKTKEHGQYTHPKVSL